MSHSTLMNKNIISGKKDARGETWVLILMSSVSILRLFSSVCWRTDRSSSSVSWSSVHRASFLAFSSANWLALSFSKASVLKWISICWRISSTCNQSFTSDLLQKLVLAKNNISKRIDSNKIQSSFCGEFALKWPFYREFCIRNLLKETEGRGKSSQEF